MLQAMPSDILLGILNYVSSWTKDNRVDFKEQLDILGICQRLRAVALPKIYNHVYITFIKHQFCYNNRYPNVYSNTFAEYIDTNADIIALANCTHMVKFANIEVYCLSTSYTELHNTIEALQSCSVVWPSIANLELDIEHCINRDGLSESQLIKIYCKNKQFCQALASTVLGVIGLELINEFKSPDISELYSQLSDAYSNQLVGFSNECNFDYTGKHKLKVLQYLDIGMSRYTNAIPCVNSHTLVELYIEDMPFNFSCSSFMDSKNDTVIKFVCLKNLSLPITDYDIFEHTDVDLPKVLLNFPVLSSLTIECDRGPCSFFKMARFPKKIEYINSDMPLSMLAQLKKVGMPTAKKVKIDSW